MTILSRSCGRAHRCDYDGLTQVPGGDFCRVPVTHRVTLGKIVELLQSFHVQPETLLLPEIPAGSFEKKLYSTYLSYLPPERTAFPLKMNVDARGSFTELLKTQSCGQFSVNITKPGVTKGQHWHHSKWEFFIVVAGHGLIRGGWTRTRFWSLRSAASGSKPSTCCRAIPTASRISARLMIW